MKAIGIKDDYLSDCPIRNILSRVASKWSLVVLHTLNDNGVMRFSVLKHHIPDISQKMLTSTLRTLVEDGFVKRTVYPEMPPRVEYELTERGHSFMLCANDLIVWAFNNMAAIMHDRKLAASA